MVVMKAIQRTWTWDVKLCVRLVEFYEPQTDLDEPTYERVVFVEREEITKVHYIGWGSWELQVEVVGKRRF